MKALATMELTSIAQRFGLQGYLYELSQIPRTFRGRYDYHREKESCAVRASLGPVTAERIDWGSMFRFSQGGGWS
jgi:hypothetical protein